jgi:hypothetical protein
MCCAGDFSKRRCGFTTPTQVLGVVSVSGKRYEVVCSTEVYLFT